MCHGPRGCERGGALINMPKMDTNAKLLGLETFSLAYGMSGTRIQKLGGSQPQRM